MNAERGQNKYGSFLGKGQVNGPDTKMKLYNGIDIQLVLNLQMASQYWLEP